METSWAQHGAVNKKFHTWLHIIGCSQNITIQKYPQNQNYQVICIKCTWNINKFCVYTWVLSPRYFIRYMQVPKIWKIMKSEIVQVPSILDKGYPTYSDFVLHVNIHIFHRYSHWSILNLSLIHIWRCRRWRSCRSRWSPYH